MANLPESSSFDAGIYEITNTDPVQGGDETALSNKQGKALANRTRYLKDHIDAAETAITALQVDVAADPTTPAAGDDDTSAATTAFVHRNSGGYATVDCTGAGNIVLDSDHWGAGVVILTGARTGNGNVIFPTRGDRWLVVNRCTGGFKLTCKTATGAGVTVAQGLSKDVWCDAVDILNAETDQVTKTQVITGATTLAVGGDYFCDFTGGVFAVTAPPGMVDGDSFVVRGNFLASNLIVNRNGQSFYDANGTPSATNAVLDRNNLAAKCTMVSGAILITQG